MKKVGIITFVAVLLLVGGVWWSNSLSSSGDIVETIGQNGIHWHPQLEIYIKGKKQDIPHNIGLVGVHNPIHTHDDVPIIHMEFSGKVTGDNIKLGNFFRVWGKEFNSTTLFNQKNGPEGIVRMFVNGQENREFENYQMHDGDKIEIRYE